MLVNEKYNSGYAVLAKLIDDYLEKFRVNEYYIDFSFPIMVYFESRYKGGKFKKDTVIYCPCSGFDNDFDEGQCEYKLIGITPMEVFYNASPIYKVEEEKDND